MATLITGASGLVGHRLVPQLDDVIITSRNATQAKQKFGSGINDVIQWDPASAELNLPAQPPINAVVNLMGESIATGRWSEAKKKSIRDSRVLGTKKLVAAILAQPMPPSVFVSASAVGYYGSRGDEKLTESSPSGTGFLAEVCKDWEAASLPLEASGIRVVRVRFGIVLANEGGALPEILKPFRMGLGGPLGNGKQYFPWIHIDDVVGIILHAINVPTVRGTVNAAAPGAVTNKQWTQELANAVGRPALIPVPKFALRLTLGEFADSLFFSQQVVPNAILASGYKFKYPDLSSCLRNLIKNK